MALQHLRSSTASKRPDPAAMSDGQLAINTAATTAGLFFKDAGGALAKVGPIHVGTTAPNATPASGGSSGNSLGEGWLDTSGTNPVLKIWNGSAFVIAQPNASGTLVTTGDTGTVTSTMIANGTIVDADINASAAIAYSKLAALTSGNILVGNGSNVPVGVAVTGDVTISNAGVTAIGSGVIVNADISASAEIAVSKLADGAARQVLQTDAAGTGVEWTDNLALPGTLSVTGETTLKEIKETTYTLGTSGSIALNPSNGSIQSSVLAGAPTFTDSLEAGQTIVLMLENGASYTVTWPTITWVTSAGNAAPTLTAKDTLVFWKVSTTLYGAYVGSYV